MSAVAYPSFVPQSARTQSARTLPVRTQQDCPQVRPQVGVNQTRLVLTRRGRRVLTILVAVPLALAAFFAALSTGQAAANDGTAVAADSSVVADSTITWITVEAGDTLWSLANDIAPTKDPRDVIADIVSLNQLHSDLQPGQRIALPSGY